MSSSGAGEAGQDMRPTNPVESIVGRQPVAEPGNYEMRVGPGWTLNDGTYTHVPQTRRYKRDVPRPLYVDLAHEAMYALSSLQVAHNAPITMCALDIAVEHLWRCLPEEVQHIIDIEPPNGPELWSEDEEAVRDMYEKMKDDADTFYQDMKKKQWVVWPIYVEDEFGADWLVIFWYAQESKPGSGVFDRIRMTEIYDARRDTSPRQTPSGPKHDVPIPRRKRVGRRFEELVSAGGYDLSGNSNRNARISPMEIDEHTSGERCYHAVKEIFQWIVNRHFADPFDVETQIFPSLSRWVNPYQSRIEMAGINAWILMATFDFNARIVVECMEPGLRRDVIVGGEERLVEPKELAGPSEEPLAAASDFMIEPYDDDDEEGEGEAEEVAS
ncbi:hypothetical protein F5B19DRAFT_110533 [Rostrohypoxylon terebratum]|nr:hypothetical protein F5B19DRAFT_110533 [Rostrohypoxylon terebratum]